MNRSRIKPTIGQQHVSAVNSSFWWLLLFLLIKPLGMITESWTHFETYILLIVYIFTERLNKNTVRACVLCTFTQLTKRSFNSWKCGSLPYFMCYEQVLEFFFMLPRCIAENPSVIVCHYQFNHTVRIYECSEMFKIFPASFIIWCYMKWCFLSIRSRDYYSIHSLFVYESVF